MISSIIQHAALNHADTEIVSRTMEDTTPSHHLRPDRATHAPARPRAATFGREGGRPGGHARLEWVSAIWSCITPRRAWARCTTPSIPRLGADDIAYIIADAGDAVIFADTSFVALLEALAPPDR